MLPAKPKSNHRFSVNYKSIFRSEIFEANRSIPFNISDTVLDRYNQVHNMNGMDATGGFT